VILRQLEPLLDKVQPADWATLVLAYEPVWAIGTGRNATPDDAAQVHELIRFTVGRRGVPGRVPILYGGSVNAGNVLSLLARPELDGVLVGGASLDADGWGELVGLGGAS
jgi:triosephosphate isomerase